VTSGTGLTTMPECRCRTPMLPINERKTNDAGLNFLSAFRHPWCLSISMSMVLVHLHVHGPCPCFMSMLNVHVLVHVHAAHHMCVRVCECVFACVCVCINAGMSDCPASDQSGTGMKITNDAGAGPVPDQAKAFRHFFGPVPD
jgi:hypothetical protein